MTEAPEQYDAAVSHLLGLLVLVWKKPEAFEGDDLPNWLLLLGNERERQGDFGAARLLDAWSDEMAKLLDRADD